MVGERKKSAGKESYVQESLNGSEKGRMVRERERGRNRRKPSGRELCARELEREGERKNNEREREREKKLQGDFRDMVCGRRLERVISKLQLFTLVYSSILFRSLTPQIY